MRYELDEFVASVHARVLAELAYLSEPVHGEMLDRLVRRFLDSMGAQADRPINADPMRVALVVADEIDKRYRKRSARFEFSSMHTVVARDHEWRVPENFSEPVDRMPVRDWGR